MTSYENMSQVKQICDEASFRVTSWYDVISSRGLIILVDIVTRACLM